ncbi:MAG: metalloregulator ArsR/SmtB family transcription factor [Candidatus Binatia bacterium]
MASRRTTAAAEPPADLLHDLARALQALGDPVRQRILFLLGGRCREANVGELAAEFHLTRPAVSHHLKVLHTAGLVTDDKRGRERYYGLDGVRLRRLLDQLRAFLDCCGCC